VNIEEQIQIANPYHKSLAIDLGSFKERVFRVCNEGPITVRHTRNTKSIWKKPLPIALVIVSVGLLGFTYASFQWFGNHITMDSTSGNLSTLQTPLESWTNTIQDWHIQHPMTLEEARSESSYPIREPVQISGWTLVQDFGFKTLVTNTGANGTVSHSTGPEQFLDFWINSAGQKVAVLQHPSNIGVSNASNVGFPAGSYQVASFKPDLTVMMNLQNGRLELAVFHIESNKTVTELDFYGTTSASALETFAEVYLASTTN